MLRFMKHTAILVLVALAASVGFAFTHFGPITQRSLPDAYQIAVQTVGSRTNDLECVAAKRTKEGGLWDFVFEGTNATRVVVIVSDISPVGSIDSSRK